MKITAICVTYLRPHMLGQLIGCFHAQEYPAHWKELIILDDAGQYDSVFGDNWRLLSLPSRFRTLGEKRNAAIGLVRPDTEAIAVWDDDDLYLPWALSTTAEALEKAPWSRPGQVIHRHQDRKYYRHATGGLYHGGWGFRLDAFHQAGGYPPMNNGEDRGLASRFRREGIRWHDPCESGCDPFYIYRWGGRDYHLSGLGPDGYERLGRRHVERATIRVELPPGYREIELEPGILPRPF